MQSQDRRLFSVVVRQETKTGFLNLSDLQASYEVAKNIYGWSEKKINDIINNASNRERIFYILEEQGVMFTPFHVFIEDCEKEGIIRVLKRIGVYKATGTREKRTTLCNPYIWTLIAMELNPRLYAKVVKWMTDGLIINRIEAGNFYKDFSRAIGPWKPDYAKVAKALNYVIFNRHEPGIRNTATEKQLNELVDLEKQTAFAIDMGYILSENQLIEDLRKMWHQKWDKKI
jgi:hypothetical protein